MHSERAGLQSSQEKEGVTWNGGGVEGGTA